MDEMSVTVPERAQFIQESKDRISAGFEEIRRQHENGVDGLTICRNHVSLMDEIVLEIYQRFFMEHGISPDEPGQKSCIVALGGYGRKELNPFSDIDLLFLHPERTKSWYEEMVHYVISFLWDLGLQVGHSTRTVHHCIQIALEDITARTAMLDARFLMGGKPSFDEFQFRFRRKVIDRMPGTYIKERIRAMTARHKKYFHTVYLAEPDIKESPGGLRDYHNALWCGQIRFGIKNLEELIRRGILEQREADLLKTAIPHLLRIRNGLHFLTNRKTDLVHHGLQLGLAVQLGYSDSEEGHGVIEMMRDYYREANVIYKISKRVLDRCDRYSFSVTRFVKKIRHRSTPEGFVIGDSEVYWKDGPENPIKGRPDLFLSAFRIAAENDLPLSYRLIQWIREAIHSDGGQMIAALNEEERFLSIFRGLHCAKILRWMQDAGVLGVIIPEFQAINQVTHFDHYHRFTVDEHTLRGLEILESVGQEKDPELEEYYEVYQNEPNPEILKMTMLFHDLGKHKRAVNHDEESANQLEKIFQRVGLKRYRDELRTLVREHGLMSYTASRLNIYEERTIREFGDTIASDQALRRLFLITYADTNAVGPDVWSTWKKRLLSLLYQRTLAYFEQGDLLFLAEEDAVKEVKKLARELVANEVDPERVDSFISQMSPDYFLSRSPEKVAAAIRFQSQYNGGPEPMVGEISQVGGYQEVMICARNQLGLFSRIAGTLTSKNIRIIRAKINTFSDDTAVDFLVVSGPNRTPIKEPKIWERFQKDLHLVLTGEKDVEELLRKRQTIMTPFKPEDRQIPTRVTLINDVSDTHTVIEVSFEDRIGALYLITNALYQADLDIFSAKVTTEGMRGVNSFYITDRGGKKIVSPDQLEKIKSNVIEALDREF